VDLPDKAELRAVEALHWGAYWNVAGTVWIVGHAHLLGSGLTIC
jgi:hypothetical protein